MRKLILSALILASAFQTATGQTYTSGDYQYTLSNGQATITGYTGAGGAVAIPSLLNSYLVVSIGNYAFSNTNLTSVTIPNSVTSIGSGAFNGCDSLTTFTIPSSVTSIGRGAFSGCTGLTTITIPSSVTSIGSYAFYYCSSLTSITIPASVTSIGESAFYYCSSLTSVTIPNSVTSIGSGAFSYCFSLTTITIPNSVTSIESSAFYRSSLTSVTIPNSVTSIGAGAFLACNNLTSIVIPNSVTSIGSGAFSGCRSLGFVSIPSSVTSIGEGAFSDSGLGSVLLPPNLSPSQITQAQFPSTAVFFVGTVGAPTSMATQADLATTQAQLATTQAQLATTQADLVTTKSQITTAINEGKASGIASVTASPNTWSLFTTSQIQNMAVGDLVLTRQVGGGFVLNYDIEQSTDLQTWTTYAPLSLCL